MNRNITVLVFATVLALYFSLGNVQGMKARIIGGRNAKTNEIKYIVSIMLGQFFCGGGIIHNKFIITAAHCIHLNETTGKLPQPIRIFAATNTRDNYNKNTTVVIDVKRAFLPAVYNERGKNDIAILELTKSLGLKKNKDRLQKLILPKRSNVNTTLYPSYDNVKFKFAGYGRSHIEIKTDKDGKVHYDTSLGGRLKVANATVIDKKTCQKSQNLKITDKHICISITEDEQRKKYQGTCRGDSGSPAVINNEILIGIDSVGNVRCDNNFRPSIFTRITSYIPFIKNVLKGKTNGTVIYTL